MPKFLISVMLLLGISLARADAVLEERVLRLTHDLRCLVCQNQTVAESNAELAVDLRRQAREMLEKGMDEDQVRAFMVERYGDFVLYRPPFKASTWLLWLGPFVLLVTACCGFWWLLSRRGEATGHDLPAQDIARAERLLQKSGKERG